MKPTVIWLLLILVGVCGQNSANVQNSKDVDEVLLDKEFSLKLGQKIQVTTGLEVELVSVVEDSRCPKGEQCIWEGNGKIELNLKTETGASTSVQLNTTSGAREANGHGYILRLVALSPYPRMNTPIDPADYVATLVACKE